MQIEENQINTPIQSFYVDQNILITGGTGFLGKLLIEKLLRSCRKLSSIYVVIRKKKNQNIEERIQHLLEQPIFNGLRNEFPQFVRKIIPIEGDCTLPNLGISKKDKDILLEKVSIVFHVAASVRLNNKLKQAVVDNVFGTKEVIGLCQSMTNLKVFMHVSTFYSHCTRQEIDEKFYQPPITGDRILRMNEVLNVEEFDKLENILRKNYPNNYCFTKAMAEEFIQQHAKELPIGIFRPSVVLSTYQEPIDGWTDSFAGLNGIIAGGISGFLKAAIGNKSRILEIVPADLSTNALITCAWDVALNKSRENEPFIYNYNSTWTKAISLGEFFNLAEKYEVPSIKCLRSFNVMITKYYWAYEIAKTILQTVPAIVFDTVLISFGKKTWAMKTNKTLDSMVNVSSTFALRDWVAKNERMKSLWETISLDDKKLFPFSMEHFDWHDYMQKYMIGIRVYLLKDPLDTVPAAKILRLRYNYLYYFVAFSCLALVGWFFIFLLSNMFL